MTPYLSITSGAPEYIVKAFELAMRMERITLMRELTITDAFRVYEEILHDPEIQPEEPPMQCHICGKGPAPEHGGVTVYRQNEKGVPGIWACEQHRKAPVDPETQDIVDIIEGKT